MATLGLRANVSGRRLSPSGMIVEELKDQAVGENGLFVLRERKVDKDDEERESVSYYQDPKGRLPLSPVDTDARWRTRGYGYLQNQVSFIILIVVI